MSISLNKTDSVIKRARIARIIIAALFTSILGVVAVTPSLATPWVPSLEVVASADSVPLANLENTDSYTATINGEYETFTVWNPTGQIDTQASLSAFYTSGVFDFTPSVVNGEDTLTVSLRFYNNIDSTLRLEIPIVGGADPVVLDFAFTSGPNKAAPVLVDATTEALEVSVDADPRVSKTTSNGKIFIRTESEYETITLSSLNGTADFITLRSAQQNYAISEASLTSSNFNYFLQEYGGTFDTATIVLNAPLGNLPTKYTFTAFTNKETGRKKIGSIDIYAIRVNSFTTPETTTILVGDGSGGDGQGASSVEATAVDLPTGRDGYSVWISSTTGSVLLNSLAGLPVGALSITSSNPETATARQVGSTNQIMISGVDTGTATLTISAPDMAPATLTVSILDNEAPVITGSDGSIQVGSLSSWTGLTARATDNDGLVDLTDRITPTYMLSGITSATLAEARAFLATAGETVTVTYDGVVDHSGNPATALTRTFTSVPTPQLAPSAAEEEALRQSIEKGLAEKAAADKAAADKLAAAKAAADKAAADKLAAEKAAADAVAAKKLADEKAAAEKATAEKAAADAAAALKAQEEKKAKDAADAIAAKAAAMAAANTGRVKSTKKSTILYLDLADKYFGRDAKVELVTGSKVKTLESFVVNQQDGNMTVTLRKLVSGQKIQIRIGKAIVFRATA